MWHSRQMAFDFPSSPTNGQEFASGGATYVWNGYGWRWKMSGGLPGLVVRTAAVADFKGLPVAMVTTSTAAF